MFRQALRFNRLGAVVGATGVLVAVAEVTTHAPSQGRSSPLYHALTDRIVTPIIRRTCNPEQAHDLAIGLAALGPHYSPSQATVDESKVNMEQEVWKGLLFPNPIGLAAGFDKDGKAMEALLNTGFGFIEIGSVTLKAQPGNPSPRMFRLVEDQAVINRYGFNSLGVQKVKENLQTFRQHQLEIEAGKLSLWQKIFGLSWTDGIIGVNLGKNKISDTPLEDYKILIAELGPYADYLVINVSSPNTPGLRDLQASSSLEYLLSCCLRARDQLKFSSSESSSLPPLLVKLSPDLSDKDLKDICKTLVKVKVDGIILTNTTTARPETLQSPNKGETGGLSGRPLGERSTECIRQVYQWTGGKIPIIGVGGIFTARDVYEKLKAGASVVQIYSAMVYQGPGMVSRLRHELMELMVRDGYQDIREVIGLEHRSNDAKVKQTEVPPRQGEVRRRLRWWA